MDKSVHTQTTLSPPTQTDTKHRDETWTNLSTLRPLSVLLHRQTQNTEMKHGRNCPHLDQSQSSGLNSTKVFYLRVFSGFYVKTVKTVNTRPGIYRCKYPAGYLQR